MRGGISFQPSALSSSLWGVKDDAAIPSYSQKRTLEEILATPKANFAPGYRGRLAPSPTGYLHAGHVSTFRAAFQRARQAGGKLILRIEDISLNSCRPEFDSAVFEDLKTLGLYWDEGPDVGGAAGPYRQSERHPFYRSCLEYLLEQGHIYPARFSRNDLAKAGARRDGDGGYIVPDSLRPPPGKWAMEDKSLRNTVWRFRVPYGRRIEFLDTYAGPYSGVAGVDFGDFMVWSRDGTASYELAVVLDDWLMGITEVVRGQDLMLSTLRQLLIYGALGLTPPAFFHVPLLFDPKSGKKLSKRDRAARYIQKETPPSPGKSGVSQKPVN